MVTEGSHHSVQSEPAQTSGHDIKDFSSGRRKKPPQPSSPRLLQRRLHTTWCSKGDLNYSLCLTVNQRGSTARRQQQRQMKISPWWQWNAAKVMTWITLLVFFLYIIFGEVIHRCHGLLSWGNVILPPLTTLIITMVLFWPRASVELCVNF